MKLAWSYMAMLKCIHRIMESSKRAEEVAGVMVAMNGMRKRWRRDGGGTRR